MAEVVDQPGIKEYLEAGYPCLFLPTVEPATAEDRIRKAMLELGDLKGQTMFVWKVTNASGVLEGMPGTPREKMHSNTRIVNLIDALAYIETSTRETSKVGIFHNVREYLKSPDVIQAMQDAILSARMVGSHVILIGPYLDVPPELRNMITFVDCPLPTVGQIQEAYSSLTKKYEDQLNLPSKRDERETLLRHAATAAVGLDMMGAENALALSMAICGGVDLKTIQRQKEQEVKKSDVLEFISTDETMENVGGFKEFKEWMRRRDRVFTDEARKYGLPYPKGVLIVGLAGTGKSLVAKACATYLKLPLLRLDMGKVFRSLVGESLHGDQEIYFSATSKGERVSRMTIREAFMKGQRGFTLSYSDHGAVCWAPVINVVRHDRKERFLRVTTRRGYSVIVTEGHSLFTRRPSENISKKFGEIKGKPDFEGGKLIPTEARFLSTGNKIAISRFIKGPRRDRKIADMSVCGFVGHVTPSLAKLVGLWLADGTLSGKSLRFSCSKKEPEIIEFLRSFAPLTFCGKKGLGIDITMQGSGLAALFSSLGIISSGTNALRKRVPEWVCGMSNEVVASLISGYFSGDGSFSGHNLEVSSVSRRLIEDVAFLLRRFGIVPYIKDREEKGSGLCKGKICASSFRLIISKALELDIFQRKIGFMVEKKNKALDAFLQGQKILHGYSPKKTRYSIIWDEVESIKPVKSEDPYSYDLSVKGMEKFVSGGIVVHNSEAAIRMALQVVEAVSPAVLWVDEIDKGLAGMEAGGNLDSGVTSRVISTVLTWRQETKAPVFLAATANKVTAIPSMVYRKGRLDEVWGTDLPSEEEREEIFSIHLRKRNREPKKFDLGKLSSVAKEFTGAEIEAAIEDAMFSAFDKGEEITTQYILKAIKETKTQADRDREEVKVTRDWVNARARKVSGEPNVEESGVGFKSGQAQRVVRGLHK